MSLSVKIRHAFPGFRLDVAFEAASGVTALFGRSGAGKSSVVNAVAGLLRPDHARIEADGAILVDTDKGTWLPPYRRRVGYVFQDARLFPHLDVRGNLMFGAGFASDLVSRAEVERVVAMLGVGDLLTRRVGDLSGGERQRVAIGRALLSAPRLLLLDEPMAALDEARKAEILPYLERLRDEAGVPILFVSHQITEIARLARDVVVLDHGGVVRSGLVEEVMADPLAIAATAVRDAGAVIAARVVAHHADGLTELSGAGGTLFLPRVKAAPGAQLRVRIAAQDVILSVDAPQGLSALNVLAAEVISVTSGSGPGAMVQLRAGPDLLLARVTRRSAEMLGLDSGQPVHAIVKSVAVAAGDVSAVPGG